jgi:hypothetical protein
MSRVENVERSADRAVASLAPREGGEGSREWGAMR